MQAERSCPRRSKTPLESGDTGLLHFLHDWTEYAPSKWAPFTSLTDDEIDFLMRLKGIDPGPIPERLKRLKAHGHITTVTGRLDETDRYILFPDDPEFRRARKCLRELRNRTQQRQAGERPGPSAGSDPDRAA